MYKTFVKSAEHNSENQYYNYNLRLLYSYFNYSQEIN